MRDKVILQKDFVKALSDKSGYTQVAVKEILDSLDDTILELTKEATEDMRSRVNITHGIHVGIKYYKPKKIINFEKEEVLVEGSYKPYIHFGKEFKEKITELKK